MKPNERIDGAIEKAAERSEAFVSFIARSWRPIAGGAAALFAISLGILWITLYRPFAGKAQPIQAPVQTAPTSTALYRALDGVEVADATSTNLLPLGVMVENSTDAWPLSGPAKANVVFEAPVEGSITRFFLLFDPTTASGDIGPVRSARPYYVDIAEGFGALYGHVGGSPEALAKIKSMDGFKDLDEYFNGGYFRRSASKPPPHNVFTDVTKLSAAAEKKGWSATSTFASWTYEDAATSTAAASASTTIKVPYAGAYAASWVYDPVERVYTRFQNGKVQKDADGKAVTVKNAVLIATDAEVLDNVGRLRVRTDGSGDAVIAHDGKIVHGRWTRKNGENFRFITADGSDVPLGRGKSWVSIVTGGLENVVQ
jgi:hypothetical protein